MAVAESGRLVREEHLAIGRLSVRVLEWLTLLAKGFGRRDRLAEIMQDHLGGLRVQAREKSLDLFLKSVPGRPPATLLPDGDVSFDQPRPKPDSFLADGGEDQPALARRRKPGEFYRAVSHGGILSSSVEKTSV